MSTVANRLVPRSHDRRPASPPTLLTLAVPDRMGAEPMCFGCGQGSADRPLLISPPIDELGLGPEDSRMAAICPCAATTSRSTDDGAPHPTRLPARPWDCLSRGGGSHSRVGAFFVWPLVGGGGGGCDFRRGRESTAPVVLLPACSAPTSRSSSLGWRRRGVWPPCGTGGPDYSVPPRPAGPRQVRTARHPRTSALDLGATAPASRIPDLAHASLRQG